MSQSLDQAAGLRQRVHDAPLAETTTPIVAVASGKGGVGKTFVTTNLAVLMARRGKRVLLVDGDLGLSNVDVALATRARHTIEDVISGRVPLKDAVVTGPGGFHLLAGGSGIRSLTALDGGARRRILDELVAASPDYDIILVDCGAGIGDNVMFFAQASSRRLLVVNAEPTSLIDAYATTKAMSQVGIDDVDVIVNAAVSRQEAQDVFGRLVTVVGRFLPVRLHFLGGVPKDDSVRRAVMARQALVLLQPQARAALALERLERDFSRDAKGGDATWWDRLTGGAGEK
jgi:flagellar biosynthesis protein FlhG